MVGPSLDEVPNYDDSAEALAEFSDGPATVEIPPLMLLLPEKALLP